MKFKENLIEATFIKRYKRFLVDVELASKDIITVHCANSGRMTSCLGEGWKVLLSDSKNPKRKLRYSLEMVHNGDCWIMVNTHRANHIVKEAILNNEIAEIGLFDEVLSEIKYGKSSRIDLLIKSKVDIYLEVKSVTLLEGNRYLFPDAVSSRGQKHLQELMDVVKDKKRAIMFYLVQRSDGDSFSSAIDVDPVYSSLLIKAIKAGVEVYCYESILSPSEMKIGRSIPLVIE
ncbi:MAG: DNA/RNA nuclease SfsA [Candidatus Cloacimonadota bacterium]|nr:MAG: DNA/RNA nuclease SfsA [Candidatus Cloacimonadota bacterium]